MVSTLKTCKQTAIGKVESGWWKIGGAVVLLCAATAIVSPAKTFATLVDFNGTNGASPTSPFVQGTDGNLYGTTELGGTGGACPSGCGTVFKITPTGTLTTIYSFCALTNCNDGANPAAPLIQATDGIFYGTAYFGGIYNAGTVFQLTSGGTLTTVLSFEGIDGSSPEGALLQATDGNLYGTTLLGGATGDGSVFEISSGGRVTLHSFDTTDGAEPVGALVEATDGSFYGTTLSGGIISDCLLGCGTVFRLTVGLSPFVQAVPTFGKVGTLVIILGTDLTPQPA